MRYDSEFLKKLDKQKHKVIYVKITALTFEETPIETIEGRITGGSINIDGASAVRRTCSLTMVAQNWDYREYLWGLNTKFKLVIGLDNTVDGSYPDVVWFNQGIYLITSFNTSHSSNNFTVTIQGKDKMCLLNGDVGGSLESSVDFGTIEEEDADGNWTIRSLPIQEIIRNAVHVYGGEPYHNIIINDLDTYGLELLEYRLDTPMYLYRAVEVDANGNVTSSPLYNNILFDGTKICSVNGETKALQDVENKYFERLVDPLIGEVDTKYVFTIDGGTYYCTKVEYGHTAGYRETDLTYAGDLIANVGESLTSVLDKIKNMLSNFEYFYDLDGRFIFQKKQSVAETLWSPDEERVIAQKEEKCAYYFSGLELFTTINNNPNLLNLRNDYVIWGERQTVSGTTVPVHLRYAIDRKPTSYTTIEVDKENPDLVAYNDKYNLNVGEQESTTYSTDDYDWREIIYRMATDYYKYNILDDFELRVAKANSDYYPSGRTGYEKYYTDIQGFWRQLYDPTLRKTITILEMEQGDWKAERDKLYIIIYGTENPNTGKMVGGLENYIIALNKAIDEGEDTSSIIEACRSGDYIKTVDKKIPDGVTLKEAQEYTNFYGDNNVPITDSANYLTLLKTSYYKAQSEYSNACANYDERTEELESKIEAYENEFYEEGSQHEYWNKAVYEAPETLNFWFDFLDSDGSELGKYSTKNIGFRTKAVNESTIKSIYFRETPDVIFGNGDLTGYRYIQIPEADMDSLFTISSQGKSAKERLDELLYNHGYCSESVTLNAIPIYHLEPNTRIYIHDDKTHIEGYYVVSKITLPLTYNGTMSITATKAAEEWTG